MLFLSSGCFSRNNEPKVATHVGTPATRPQATNESPFGKFEGTVVADWGNDEGRYMTLTQDFRYVDPGDKVWIAPKGSRVNGASIPQAFWSVIGGPFEGEYRNASVVHDVYCETMSEPWEDVHEMFYSACRCGGVNEKKAKLLYWAVYHYGPRWKTVKVRSGGPKKAAAKAAGGVRTVRVATPFPEDADLEAAKQYFENNSPDLAEIRDLQFGEDRANRRPDAQ